MSYDRIFLQHVDCRGSQFIFALNSFYIQLCLPLFYAFFTLFAVDYGCPSSLVPRYNARMPLSVALASKAEPPNFPGASFKELLVLL